MTGRPRQRGSSRRLRMRGQHFGQPRVGVPRPDELLPGPDGHLDRGKGAADQDRRRDDRPRRDLARDREMRARGEQRHLQQEPERLGQGGHRTGTVARHELQPEDVAPPLGPAAAETGEHAHRLERFRVAQAAVDEAVEGDGAMACFGERFARRDFVGERQNA